MINFAAETQIAITREVLTINIGDDNDTSVDVPYEMDDRGNAKTITLGRLYPCGLDVHQRFQQRTGKQKQ